MEGAIIEKFGWTLNYLLWKVSFARIQIMLADMPWYEYQKTESKPGKNVISLDKIESPDDIKNFIQKLNGQ